MSFLKINLVNLKQTYSYICECDKEHEFLSFMSIFQEFKFKFTTIKRYRIHALQTSMVVGF